ncbi:hypothetical protein WP2W18E01_09690 [Aeromonas caviae]|uniref:Restriction endonuclease type IV Mrr domain-containing protein n=1 Tax=Aeromonas caviae TaxID=648 RepID=A0A6S4TMW6_AERCA|nr:restriction endonuclease [Aeromonas caviae]BBQ29387.1 hypothetical protein WP2W18E01_09690 [Aeromonas caviae]
MPPSLFCPDTTWTGTQILLSEQHCRKGVFITTSSFSREAQEYVGLIEKSIVLIDGARLAALMIEYGVGVTTRQTLTIKTLDSDYFLEE